MNESKTLNLDRIPGYLGCMVVDEDQIISSQGELENNEEVAKLARKLAKTASKVPVNPDKNDPLKRISIVHLNADMYVLSEMCDIVHVKPWQFDRDLRVVIEQELNKKFANKIIYELGLCVTLFDILKIENSYIFPGDGSSHTRVTFRFVVFRPFIDEVLTGKVKACSKEGVTVSMDFFDDIFIPRAYLQQTSKYDENEKVWIWEYNTGESTHDLFMDIGENMRFKVIDESFKDTTPNAPPQKDTLTIDSETKKSPYTIIGTINEPGLGLLCWWN